uniref:hypothetical protein n=1 Tax=Halomonas sp. TaxID=1486246 RepID=UPI00261B1A9C|nr:hypothetical protein [Halomonas sp.]
MTNNKDEHHHDLDALKRELSQMAKGASERSGLQHGNDTSRSRAFTQQELEEIAEHMAAERRAKWAAVFANWLDMADRTGTTIGALSTVALFFADKDGDALVVATSANPLWGVVIGFSLAFGASYLKALLTWRGK